MLEKVSSHINKMQNIGKITTIIEGDVSEELMQSFQAQNYLAGFEAASPKNINSIGESVVVNNYCYICVTDIKNKNYQKHFPFILKKEWQEFFCLEQ